MGYSETFSRDETASDRERYKARNSGAAEIEQRKVGGRAKDSKDGRRPRTRADTYNQPYIDAVPRLVISDRHLIHGRLCYSVESLLDAFAFSPTAPHSIYL
jgi:hypothetical protein